MEETSTFLSYGVILFLVRRLYTVRVWILFPSFLSLVFFFWDSFSNFLSEWNPESLRNGERKKWIERESPFYREKICLRKAKWIGIAEKVEKKDSSFVTEGTELRILKEKGERGLNERTASSSLEQMRGKERRVFTIQSSSFYFILSHFVHIVEVGEGGRERERGKELKDLTEFQTQQSVRLFGKNYNSKLFCFRTFHIQEWSILEFFFLSLSLFENCFRETQNLYRYKVDVQSASESQWLGSLRLDHFDLSCKQGKGLEARVWTVLEWKLEERRVGKGFRLPKEI